MAGTDDGYGSLHDMATLQREEREDNYVDFTCVSARTCGIRDKRIADYSDQEVESGELSDSDAELDVCGDDDLPDVSVVQSLSTSSNPSETGRKRKKKSDVIESGQDLYNIYHHLLEKPDAGTLLPGQSGVEMLLVHRSSELLSESDSDVEEGLNRDDIFSSSDSDYCETVPTLIDQGISELNIREHANKEKFPYIELIDITLEETEAILLLGKISQIVEDFVVIKASTSLILDVDSMVFNSNRTSVGYVFEVLGLVTSPYYSIKYNTKSDIVERGLEIGQEMFFSKNDNYTKILLVEKLKELEYQRYNNPYAGPVYSSDDSDNEDNVQTRPKLKSKPPSKRKTTQSNIHTRVTHNYTMHYEARPPWSYYNPNTFYHPLVPQNVVYHQQLPTSKPPPPPGPPPFPPPTLFAPPPSDDFLCPPGLFDLSVYDSDVQ